MRFALDLLPEGKKKVRLPRAWVIAMVFLAATLVVHLGYRVMTHENPVDKLKAAAAALEAEKSALASEMETVSSGGEISRVVRKVKFLNKLAAQRRSDPLEFFKVVESSVPDGAWIDEIVLQSGRVTIKGGAGNLDLIYSMNSNILDSTTFEGVKMTHFAGEFERLGYLTYGFSMTLKRNDP